MRLSVGRGIPETATLAEMVVVSRSMKAAVKVTSSRVEKRPVMLASSPRPISTSLLTSICSEASAPSTSKPIESKNSTVEFHRGSISSS